MPGDTEGLAADALLSGLDGERRQSLLAKREADGSLRFDIRFQGDRETVFLTFPRHEE
jgi:protocatechuate 3,4-dioxygenase alpha subunit